MPLLLLQKMPFPMEGGLASLLRDWREDAMNFLRHDAPKIVFVLLAAYVLTRLLRAIARKASELHVRKLPPGMRVQQVRTVTGVITGISVFFVFFVAALE